MKKILWISRHTMTAKQRMDLERVMGGPVELTVWEDTVRSVDELETEVAGADAVAAVLPPEMLSGLLRMAGDKPVLRAVSGRIPTGKTVLLQDGREEQEFAFAHLYWEQILKIQIETIRLS